MSFKLFATAFSDGGWIPTLHAYDGADLSPALEWNGDPPETRSFVLIAEDPDAPAGVWCHWLLYDLAPKVHNLTQGWKPGTQGLSGANSFGKSGYNGPCPPRGKPHRYFFRLFALSAHTLGLPAGVERPELLEAIAPHVLAEAVYMGRYERK